MDGYEYAQAPNGEATIGSVDNFFHSPIVILGDRWRVFDSGWNSAIYPGVSCSLSNWEFAE